MGFQNSVGFWFVWLIFWAVSLFLGALKGRFWSGFWLGLLYGPLGPFGVIIMSPSQGAPEV